MKRERRLEAIAEVLGFPLMLAVAVLWMLGVYWVTLYLLRG